jgi:transcriptional regulator with PAS, ATPase and Fis domain
VDLSNKGFGFLVGGCEAMQHVYGLIRAVSRQGFPVLVTGETGTGKELVARMIHLSGPRRELPFVTVDCAGLTPTLIEAELFGHMKGSFTGAIHNRPGLLESAGGGTLFLDEIGELPLQLQSKLLRVIQAREVRPIGSTSVRECKARIVAATNRNLVEEVAAGRFREDLFFRLNVFPIVVPSLRERRQDIPLLVDALIEKYAPTEKLPDDVMSLFLNYSWPGNVRELENIVQRLLFLPEQSDLRALLMPDSIDENELESDELVPLEQLQMRAIHKAIRMSPSKLIAARNLGIGKTTLYRKLKEARLRSKS